MADPLKLDALTRLAIRSATATLIDGGSLSVWEKAMQQALTRGHTAATLAGLAERLGVPLDSALLSERRLSERERADIKKVLKEQFGYLDNFKGEIEAGRLSDAQIRARAEMYGAAVRLTYQEARWGDWEIDPSLMPGQQQCLSNCLCRVRVEDNGDGTGVLIRELGGTEHHCTECPDLAGEYPVERRRETKAQSAQERAIFAALDEKGTRRTPKGGASHGGGGSDATPVKSRTPEETHSALMAQSKVKRLTSAQEQSLHFYQSQGHESVNNVLRGGDATQRQRDDAERTTKNIDQVMRRSHLTENVEVHRGMLATDPAAHAALARMQPGATLRENGYMSTSADPEVIKRFGGGSGWDNPYPGDTPVTMRLRVRAGTRAAYMPAVRRNSQANSERELLIDRGATYRVTDRREVNGRVELDMDVLGHDD